MPGVTVTGSVGGTPVDVMTSSAVQTSAVQKILFATASSSSGLMTGSGALTGSNTTNLGTSGSLITGSTSVASASLLLASQFGTYVTGGTTLSTVVAADYSNSSIVNSNAANGLIALTGAGGNVLQGLAGVNQFATATGGQDVVTLDGTSNTLVSEGSDSVLVGGPSTITAASGGVDQVSMAAGTTLAFINGSAKTVVDSITGASNGTIAVAGPGNTSITSGAGPETFFVDTSAGNVTLNNNAQPGATFEFMKGTDAGTGSAVVNTFAAGDNVLVHGYTGYTVGTSATNPNGSVLLLSDGSQVTFSNVSVATLQSTVKTA